MAQMAAMEMTPGGSSANVTPTIQSAAVETVDEARDLAPIEM